MAKSIVVCCDGTWNKADQVSPTNVRKFASALASTDGFGDVLIPQYFEGVGVKRAEKWLGGAFGFGLSARVREAYKFLAQHFEPGDRIYLLGFSRGAYTARSVAGMIHNVGLLRDDRISEVNLDRAFEIYRDRDDEEKNPEGRIAEEFVDANSHRTGIRFIGVWDTVGALGIPLGGLRWLNVVNRRWQFHDTQLSGSVEAAFHALAIDERRGPFVPTLWDLPCEACLTSGRRVVEQVWFSGVHSNVGGGYRETGLSDITLNWLARRAYDHGLRFLPGSLGATTGWVNVLGTSYPINPATNGKLVNSRTKFYTLLPEHVRRLGRRKTRFTEAASSSAQGRWDKDPSYRTATNLGAYLDSGRATILSVDDPWDGSAESSAHDEAA